MVSDAVLRRQSGTESVVVALTRAKALLVLVGNARLLGLDPLWRRLLRYIHENGGWAPAGMDLPDDWPETDDEDGNDDGDDDSDGGDDDDVVLARLTGRLAVEPEYEDEMRDTLEETVTRDEQ